MGKLFAHIASKCSAAVGSPWAFTAAVTLIVTWAAFGPSSGFSDTWELVINTATTIVTFLMVFLIQNTQNRDAKALHLKLDELIVAIKKADTQLLDIEDLSPKELEILASKYHRAKQRLAETTDKHH